MGRFYGSIGFTKTEETAPGVYTPVVVSRKYYGDILTNYIRYDNGEDMNNELLINNKFSIIGDSFAYENSYNMRYIVYMGTAWKITNVEVNLPRIILTVGGVYNGKQA